MTTQERIQTIHAALRLSATAMHLSVRKERGKARLKVSLFADGTAATDNTPPRVLDPVVLFARADAAAWIRFVLSESRIVTKPMGRVGLYVLRWTPTGKRHGAYSLDLQPPQPPSTLKVRLKGAHSAYQHRGRTYRAGQDYELPEELALELGRTGLFAIRQLRGTAVRTREVHVEALPYVFTAFDVPQPQGLAWTR